MLDIVPAAPAPMTLPQALADIEARVARAPIRTKPFPHIVIDDLLPSAVRQSLDMFWPVKDRLATTNYFQRGELRISVLAESSEGRERQFWSALRHLGTAVGRAVRLRLTRHLAEKFRPMIGPDWHRKLGKTPFTERDSLLAEYSGVVDLVPHVDNARVVINGFVYLDDPDQPTPDPRRGTMLYRSLGFAWPSNTSIPKTIRDGLLREAGEIGWQDNRLLAYVNGPWSFHGVPRHDLGAARRRLLMFGSLLDKGAMAKVYDPEFL
ncbi:hypothetical protein [Thalassobaculum sp.]|uniref:hypothetical protein n=1 Tax=Thalassobaculum sp. TaxID=2022740 RepID=UPI0032ED5F79